MISRTLRPKLLSLFKQYPVVTVTGPRQSGKTTLCQDAFPDLDYVSFEAQDRRSFADEDPRGFLRAHPEGAIFDEIQRVPELVSYIQEHVDARKRNGIYVLTGSQNLAVSQTISQSLAGRTALLRLLPFSISEALEAAGALNTEQMIYTGFYPRIYDQKLDPTQALTDYFETYVERDLRQLSAVRSLSTFQRFVKLCAGRIGQLLNLQSLGNDAGVSHATAREWIGLLEASYIAFLLRPFHPNVSKRLIKSPKLYFYDVGFAAYLLGIEDQRQITSHPLRGSLFENLVVVEALKHRYNQARPSNLYFYRENTGREVDLLYTTADHILAIEIKAGATLTSSFFTEIQHFSELVQKRGNERVLIYDGEEKVRRQGTLVANPFDLEKILAQWEKSQE